MGPVKVQSEIHWFLQRLMLEYKSRVRIRIWVRTTEESKAISPFQHLPIIFFETRVDCNHCHCAVEVVGY